MKKQSLISEHIPLFHKENGDIYIIKFGSGENDDEFLKHIGNVRGEVYSAIGAKFQSSESDQDKFDNNTTHILLWNRNEDELIGGYRLFPCWEFFDDKGANTYLSNIFNFSNEFISKHKDSIEIGRSFIQKKYWNKNYLDYLWFGIGEYLKQNKRAKYFYGTVSLGREYSAVAVSLICAYYRKWYWKPDGDVQCHPIYEFPKDISPLNNSILSGKTSAEDYKILRHELKKINSTVPVLLRKYVSLTKEGGTKFISFSYDQEFEVVSLLCLVDLGKLSPLFHKRYLG